MPTVERADRYPEETGRTQDVDVDDRERFYRTHLPYVLAVLTRGFRVQRRDGSPGVHRVTDPYTAEDLSQDAFAAFFHQVESGKFDRSRPALPYLRKIAVNLALRRAGREGRELPLDDVAEPTTESPPSLEREELRGLMSRFRGSLSEREQEVLQCLADEELRSQAAIGERLGLSRDQVYRTLVAIRRRASAYFREKGWLP